MQGKVYPHVIIFAKYDDVLMIRERIILPDPHVELVLRKPENLSYLKIKDSQRIVEEQKDIYVSFKREKNEIELQYTIDIESSLLPDWIVAPKKCYTLDATIRTPLPLKSIINATIYGFHSWGKHGYSRWINSIPRRKYVLTTDNYLIVDDENYILASLDENSLDRLRILVNNIYTETKDIIPWNKPIVIHNNKIDNRTSTNIAFIRDISWKNILVLLIRSIVNDLEGFPKIDKLIDAIDLMIKNGMNYKENMRNPYMGLVILYGKNAIKDLLKNVILTCPNNIKHLLRTTYGEPVSNVILSLLQRERCQIVSNNNKVKCNKGPCIIVLERKGIEFLKAVLMEGDELILNIKDEVKVHTF